MCGVQDIPYTRDRKALSKEQIIHLDRCGIPNYQWSALDVHSRFKLLAYSRDKSWTKSVRPHPSYWTKSLFMCDLT
jgi:hypothetical protein